MCLTSNKWNRQGTAIHEFMHALGFQHEHSRKDRDDFVKVKVNLKELEARKDFNYSIISFSQELTRFDPFSVMLYNESWDLDRIKNAGMWNLK